MKNENENKKEIRNINIDISHIEKREGNQDKLSGYAIVFNSLSEPLYNLFKEKVMPIALERTLKQDDQLCLWGHNAMYVLGRKSAGTLYLRADDKGLYFEVTPPNTSWARDLVESVHRGDIKQMSFGFKVYDERWINDKETIKEHGMPIREITGINLYEISIVSFAAYSQSSVRNTPNGNDDWTLSALATPSANENIYIPTPPKIILEDNFEGRNILNNKKIKILKIKNTNK